MHKPIVGTGCLITCALVLAACQHAIVPLPPAPQNWTDGWQSFGLPGKRSTSYSASYEGGRWVLHAHSESSASMYRRALRIEPEQLGEVSFSWKVEALLPEADVREIETGDAVVRVLLAFDGDAGRLSARTRMMFDLAQALSGEPPPFATLMYVWDSQAGVESLVVHKRSDRLRKIVLESGPVHLGQWRSYRRDVRADYRRAFGEDPGALIGVAIMTDSDNTQSRAEAWYGEIRFE
jgi:hypothetical protein